MTRVRRDGRWPAGLVGVTVMLTIAVGCGLTPSSVRALNHAGGRGLSAGATGTGGGGAAAGEALGGGPAESTGSAGVGEALGGGPAKSTGSAGVGGAASSGGGPLATAPGAPGAITATGSAGSAGTRTGITKDTIYIGLHAPQTGAAPVPVQAFATGTKLFWENHTVFGHRVVMEFMDDQYTPSVARRDCEEMAQHDFLITGVGSDQVVACATDPVLAQGHTPYFGEGVTGRGPIADQANYFALSQTWATQTPEVWRMANQLYPNDVKGKWAIISADSSTFDEETSAAASFLQARGVTFTVIRASKYANQQNADNVVTKARQFGATAIFLLIAPEPFIDMVQSAARQLYTPAWVGPGISNALNLGAAAECGLQPNIKAAFMSPMMGIDREPPGFAQESDPPPDGVSSVRDLELYIYGASEAIYRAMLATGSIENLTRENFLAAMATFTAKYGTDLTVLPSFAFHNNRFGGQGMWPLGINCAKQQYVTIGDHFYTP